MLRDISDETGSDPRTTGLNALHSKTLSTSSTPGLKLSLLLLSVPSPVDVSWTPSENRGKLDNKNTLVLIIIYVCVFTIRFLLPPPLLFGKI